MKTPTAARTPPPKPRSPGRLRAILLAVGVHAAFFALIVFGVSWQSTPAPPVEAEIWEKLPPVKAAPPRAEPPPPKPPEPEPPKLPPPKPPPLKPPEVKPEPPKPNPEIALKAEREKRQKEKRERLERLEREKRERAEREKLEKKDGEAKKKREQEEAAKKKREDDTRRKEEDLAKAEAEKARAAQAAAVKSEVERFKAAIQAKIRGRANVPDTVSGQPAVEVLIRILPGGEVLDITFKKRSANPTYDMAIERGIRSASPLPVPPVNSELFPQFRELNLIIKHER